MTADKEIYMPVLATAQLCGFIICTCVGFVLGILYNIFSAARLCIPPLKIVSSFFDAFFWLIFTLIFFIILQNFCGGELHWFFIVGSVLGFILYLFTLSRFLMPILHKIMRFAVESIKRIFRFTFNFFVRIFHFLSPIGKFLHTFVQFILKRIINFVKKNVEIIRRFGVLLKKV